MRRGGRLLAVPDPPPPAPHPVNPVPAVGWLEQATHRRMRVHTKDDQTLEGLLVLASVDGLVLWSATLVDKQPVSLAGEVFVPRENVRFVQTVRM